MNKEWNIHHRKAIKDMISLSSRKTHLVDHHLRRLIQIQITKTLKLAQLKNQLMHTRHRIINNRIKSDRVFLSNNIIILSPQWMSTRISNYQMLNQWTKNQFNKLMHLISWVKKILIQMWSNMKVVSMIIQRIFNHQEVKIGCLTIIQSHHLELKICLLYNNFHLHTRVQAIKIHHKDQKIWVWFLSIIRMQASRSSNNKNLRPEHINKNSKIREMKR